MRNWGWGVWVAICLTAFTLVFGIWVNSLKWQEQASFDIIGILYLFTNAPNLIAWAILFFFTALTIWAWILVVTTHRRAELDWPVDPLTIPPPGTPLAQ